MRPLREPRARAEHPMKLAAATLYALRIPFVESFSHSAGERRWSDSVVVCVRDEAGTEGFGEGPRGERLSRARRAGEQRFHAVGVVRGLGKFFGVAAAQQ